MTIKQTLSKLGPGLLYAGAAIGVSHLVQSTRAGVTYGYDLIWIIILANILKYPFFEIATRYTVLTKKNLIQGYADLGKLSLYIVAFITYTTAAIVICAICLVTAGLATTLTNYGTVYYWCIGLIVASSIIVGLGKQNNVTTAVKWIVIALSIFTLAAVVWAGSNIGITVSESDFNLSNNTDLLFLIALIGWMPAPLDISFWTSFWVQENLQTDSQTTLKTSLTDFHIGYWGTTFLAILFVFLGAIVGFKQDIELSGKASEFASQLINLYTTTLGKWSFWLIAPAALAAMISTLLTVIDGYSRTAASLSSKIFTNTFANSKILWICLNSVIAILLLQYGLSSMKNFIDFITSVSFIAAPILGFLNLRLLKQSGYWWKSKFQIAIAILGLISLTVFSIFFVLNQWIS